MFDKTEHMKGAASLQQIPCHIQPVIQPDKENAYTQTAFSTAIASLLEDVSSW